MGTTPLSTSAMRIAYDPWLCETWEEGAERLAIVLFPGVERTWALKVAPPTVPAWQTFAEVMAFHDYLFRESAGGTFNPRPIKGTDDWSLHAYGLAIDLNPSANPQGTQTTDMPKVFRDSIESITAGGRRVFQWGGDWSGEQSDPMHWQVGASANEIASGVTWEEPDMPLTDADLTKIRTIVDEELDKLFVNNAENTNRISRAVMQHGGAFSGTADPKDNAQLTIKRTETVVQEIKTMLEDHVDNAAVD